MLAPCFAKILPGFGKATGRFGFSLVEVTLALGVAAFCLLSVFGLLPIGLNSNQAASEQTAASGILSSVVADLRAAPKSAGGTAVSQQFAVSIPATDQAATTQLYFTGDGQCVVSTDSRARYLLTISFLSNGASAANVTLANLKVSWPAQAKTPFGSTQTFVAIDRN